MSQWSCRTTKNRSASNLRKRPSILQISPSEPPPPPPVRRKRRSFFGPLAATLLLLVLVAGAALYAAIAFKDRDERLKIVADYAEPYVDQASGALGELKDRVRSLIGETEPTQTTTSRSRPRQASRPRAARKRPALHAPRPPRPRNPPNRRSNRRRWRRPRRRLTPL